MHYASVQDLNNLDRQAVQYGLSILQMMELAGWHSIGVFERMSWGHDKKVAIVVGPGNKGGDGLTAARHLHNYGYMVSVVLLDNKLKPDSTHHLQLLKKIKVPVYFFAESEELLKKSDIIVDAMLGYNLDGEPRGHFAECIQFINKLKKPVLAYDIPSGLDVDTGRPSKNCIRAIATLTLALPKRAFQSDESQEYLGRIFMGDVGIPSSIYDNISPGCRPQFGGRGLVEL